MLRPSGEALQLFQLGVVPIVLNTGTVSISRIMEVLLGLTPYSV